MRDFVFRHSKLCVLAWVLRVLAWVLRVRFFVMYMGRVWKPRQVVAVKLNRCWDWATGKLIH